MGIGGFFFNFMDILFFELMLYVQLIMSSLGIGLSILVLLVYSSYLFMVLMYYFCLLGLFCVQFMVVYDNELVLVVMLVVIGVFLFVVVCCINLIIYQVLDLQISNMVLIDYLDWVWVNVEVFNEKFVDEIMECKEVCWCLQEVNDWLEFMVSDCIRVLEQVNWELSVIGEWL